jgi:hypothetical protein
LVNHHFIGISNEIDRLKQQQDERQSEMRWKIKEMELDFGNKLAD